MTLMNRHPSFHSSTADWTEVKELAHTPDYVGSEIYPPLNPWFNSSSPSSSSCFTIRRPLMIPLVLQHTFSISQPFSGFRSMATVFLGLQIDSPFFHPTQPIPTANHGLINANLWGRLKCGAAYSLRRLQSTIEICNKIINQLPSVVT